MGSEPVDRKVAQLDNDVSSIYEMVTTIQLTQRRHDLRFKELAGHLQEHDVRFDGVEGRLDRVEDRLGTISARLEGFGTRLEGIDRRLDGMDARFDGMDARFDGMDARFDGMDARFDGMDARFEEVLELLRPGGTQE